MKTRVIYHSSLRDGYSYSKLLHSFSHRSYITRASNWWHFVVMWIRHSWHFMMTSSNGNIFRVTGPLCGEFTGHRWITSHKGQWRGVLMFSLICAWKKRLSQQSGRWWFEKPSRSFWRHCNGYIGRQFLAFCRYMDRTFLAFRIHECISANIFCPRWYPGFDEKL